MADTKPIQICRTATDYYKFCGKWSQKGKESERMNEREEEREIEKKDVKHK